jgi:hypothetical protein
MAEVSVPFSKYDALGDTTSWVIFRRSVGRLNVGPGGSASHAFGTFGEDDSTPRYGSRDLIEPADSLDTFEPMIRKFEDESKGLTRLREIGAALALIAVAIVGAGLWSRSEATEVRPVAISAPSADLGAGRSSINDAFSARVRADVAELDMLESGQAAPQPTEDTRVTEALAHKLNPALRHKPHPPRVRQRPAFR